MMLQDQLITASFILGGSQQAHLQVFQNLLLVCRKLPSFCFCHPRTVKKSGAVVPQKVISSLPARGLSPQKPRPKDHRFVVSAEKKRRIRPPWCQERFNHLARSWATIDVIPEKHHPVAGYRLETLEEKPKS